MIYQILTDRFRKGGGSLDNRGITRRMGGDFAGIVEAIEEGYFQNLGANVLWISPAYTNARGEWPGFDGRSYESYHGYWPVAAREADPLWGGEDGLDELVRVAHGHGLRLILDVVPNHVHIEHPYFQEHRREWFNHPDIDCVCGRECSWTKDIEHCWFTDYLPDLDWTNTTVLNTMEDDCLWWLDRFNLDGLRIDAVAMMPRLATRHLRHRVSNTFEQNGMHVYLIGETFTGEGGRDDIRASLGPQGLSAQFDFPVMWSLRSTIGQDGGNLYDVLDALTASEESFQGSGAVMGMIVGNHDVPRFLSVANLDNVDDPLSPPAHPLHRRCVQQIGLGPGRDPYHTRRSNFLLWGRIRYARCGRPGQPASDALRRRSFRHRTRPSGHGGSPGATSWRDSGVSPRNAHGSAAQERPGSLRNDHFGRYRAGGLEPRLGGRQGGRGPSRRDEANRLPFVEGLFRCIVDLLIRFAYRDRATARDGRHFEKGPL